MESSAKEKGSDMGNPWIEGLPSDRLAQVVADKGEMLVQRYHVDDVYFAYWLHVVNVNVQRRVHVSFDDLEDWDYAAAYEGGMEPRDAAIEMLADNGWDEAYE